MRPIDACKLEAQCKEIIAHEWNKKAAPVSWAHAYESFLDMLETATTIDAQQWIPAGEPPKKWKIPYTGCMIDYLAYSQADGATYLANWYKPAQCWMVDGETVAISHWMPLPEGPKE